ncbi:MAG: phosphatase PAP2 family protein [Bacteroidetes bacterium]|nr:phosphatase PAP2 family protein [Bacteroidota bacterium]
MVRLFIKRGYSGWVAWLLSFTRSERAVLWERKYPKIFRFVILRFDPQHFRGLPLSFLLVGFLLNAFILSNVAEELLELSRLSVIDKALANYFFTHRNEQVAHGVYFFTQVGSFPSVASVMLIFAGLMLWKKRYHALISSFAALLASTLTAYAGKWYYQLPRPQGLAWYDEFSYSFPSGHATVSMAFYGFLFYLLLMYVNSARMRYFIFCLSIIFILGMGFSRIYLCVHYLSDVLGGFAIGFVWLIFSIAILSWLDFRKEIAIKN